MRKDASEPAEEAEIATAPVTLDGAVLFRVTRVSSFPAEARARRIEERLTAAAADPAHRRGLASAQPTSTTRRKFSWAPRRS